MSDVIDLERAGLAPGLQDVLERKPEEARDFIYCSACSTVIARQTDRFEVNGSHDHSFVNPYGYQYRIGCFREALGCSISGAPQAADSWFTGFQWQLAACSDCRRHLGWHFERGASPVGGDHFYGLILDRIQHE